MDSSIVTIVFFYNSVNSVAENLIVYKTVNRGSFAKDFGIAR